MYIQIKHSNQYCQHWVTCKVLDNIIPCRFQLWISLNVLHFQLIGSKIRTPNFQTYVFQNWGARIFSMCNILIMLNQMPTSHNLDIGVDPKLHSNLERDCKLGWFNKWEILTKLQRYFKDAKDLIHDVSI